MKKLALVAAIITASPAQAFDTPETRIVGGISVNLNDSRYEDSYALLSISYKYTDGITGESNTTSYRCGGTLIDQQTVVTAAHCVQVINGEKPNHITLTFKGGYGDYSVQGQSYVIHQQWNNNVMNGNDIALITLDQAVINTPMLIGSAKQSAIMVRNHMKVMTAGYGITVKREYEDAISSSDLSSQLKIVDETLAPNSECDTVLGTNISSKMMCTLDKTESGTCQGDSGGPMFTHNASGQSVLIGIVSAGWGCGIGGIPSLFTNVSWHLDNSRENFLDRVNLQVNQYNVGDFIDQAPINPAGEYQGEVTNKGTVPELNTNKDGGTGSMGLGLALLGIFGAARRFKK
jgi:secreted trypsin-like serine protease